MGDVHDVLESLIYISKYKFNAINKLYKFAVRSCVMQCCALFQQLISTSRLMENNG